MLYQWDIVGHKKQLSQLEEEISSKKLTHAYLFSGPKQSGKFSIAMKLAAILQCPNQLCRNCKDCKLFESGSHPDTVVIEDHGESIKIDDVRELIRKTNLTSQGGQRIVLIENIERMPLEAQNSFLKTLEEPPGKTIFLLTTSQLDQVLVTIQSRVRHYHFSTISDSVLETYLKEHFGAKPELAEVVNIAQGRPGLAISLLKEAELLDKQKGLYRQIEGFLKKNDLSAKFALVESIEKDPIAIEQFLDAFTRYLRKLVFDHVQGAPAAISHRFSLKELVNLFDVLEKTRYFIGRNVNKRLALENLLIQTEK